MARQIIYIGEDIEYAQKQYYNLLENGWDVNWYVMNGIYTVSIKNK